MTLTPVFMHRARSHPEKYQFLSQYDPTDLKDDRETAITVVTLGTRGTVLWLNSLHQGDMQPAADEGFKGSALFYSRRYFIVPA